MATRVEMPKLGNTVEECLLTAWRKTRGDPVQEGEVIADIETDKTTFELTAPAGGILLETFFEAGALIPVFSTVCVIGEVGESVEELRGSTGGARPDDGALPGDAPARDAREAAAAAPPAGAGPAGVHSPRVTSSSVAASGPLSPRARRFSREHGFHPAAVAGSGPFCAIQALLAVPDVNVEFIDGKIHKHREVHMAFACDTPRGLMVPVVRDAHTLTAGQLSVKMKELTAQAVKGTVSPDDLSGGTFTVSNLGGLGIESFTPVLNPPQVAILGVDSIQLKPVRREGRIEFIDAIGLSITFDHQVIDGAPGARFLKVVKEKIENVESICTI
jgi:pyruvate/2-oxoglutarate dehydrogenase complex dihydrolipoamide acyltransferase (E2) component